MGKCVVIGLQSTGEARTMEALEREEELTDFVSTAKGVLQVRNCHDLFISVISYIALGCQNCTHQISGEFDRTKLN